MPHPYSRDAEYRDITASSRYLTMRDGVRIAVDLYLPADLPEGNRIPTILHQTRYWRSVELIPPARFFFEGLRGQGRFGRMKRYIVERGYAWIDVDTRGTGASFGLRAWDYAPDEILDGGDLVDWIVQQPWSDGRVGGVGASYSGVASELLLLNGRPEVKLALPLFAEFDQYTDVIAPGGVPHRAWLERWGRFTAGLDRGELLMDGLAPRFVVGVRPVDGDRDHRLLDAAQREHTDNYDFRAMERVTFRDDAPIDLQAALNGPQRAARERSFRWLKERLGPDFLARGTDLASPHGYANELERSGAPFYAYSGWFDGAYAGAAVRRYHAVVTPGRRLTLGPWDHALHDISPHGRRGPTRFDHEGELLKFVDHHLGERQTGVEEELPVHYYTMGAETWRASDRWPPASVPHMLYLAENGQLNGSPPRAAAAHDRYVVDFEAGTGPDSRWGTLAGRPLRTPYPDRTRRDEQLLHYTSAPLPRDTEVTGHPIVQLFAASSARDGAFFAYLEDVAPDGSVTYVTEGMLRALHRRYASPASDDPLGLPQRSYRRADGAPLVPGEVAEITFDLMPTSYVFRAGHAIRLALSGADADHFARIPLEGTPEWQLQRSRQHASRLLLPVVEREDLQRAARPVTVW